MKYSASTVLASAGWAAALTRDCSNAKMDGGAALGAKIWSCSSVEQILYEGIQGNGVYKAVTHMDAGGECSFEDKSYKGPLAPLDEGLSIHIRGPVSLKEFAVYNLASKPKSKRDVETSPRAAERGHNQGHRHLHRAHRAQRDMVIATINDKVVSWENDYFPGGAPATKTSASAPAATTTVTLKKIGGGGSGGAAAAPSGNSKSGSEKPPVDGKPAPSGSDWDRVSYYNAEKKTAQNLVFLGNYGGAGSGVWDTTWGNSLAYLNANGDGGASSPQILTDTLIPSVKEFSIFSGEKCDESCGFSRAKDVAYKGFAGANKVFVFRFKMPRDATVPSGQDASHLPIDMPAIWALNARIPRAIQYPSKNPNCTCHTSGCGEFDIFEILDKGESVTKGKSHFHIASGGGSSYYLDRPVDKFIKLAVIFHEKKAMVSVKKISDDVDLKQGLDDKTVLEWLAQPNDPAEKQLSALFQFGK
ncbi:target of Sbf [Conoideocrella luteorostrata]|uniref:glucan endo-1,3-beta-D-glucosidase n=1 Tax=Conoideocrella luteorostrata TaxID=1105319 RepID=A0AAJ0CL43_9HYPO|nr:target of Sbf [Conoideocrella luteorostrata]